MVFVSALSVNTEIAKLTLSPCAALEREAFFTNKSGASPRGGVDVIVGTGEAVAVPASVVEVGTAVAGTAVDPTVVAVAGTAVDPTVVAVAGTVVPGGTVFVGAAVGSSGVSVERAAASALVGSG